MSNQYGPRIVTDGLVLHLDAANRKSYPGSGSTWYDLSGNGNNFTLTNGASYNTNGYFTTDGVNDYIVSSNTVNLSSYTYIVAEMWIKSLDDGTYQQAFEHSDNWNNYAGAFGLYIHNNGSVYVKNEHHTNHKNQIARNYVVQVDENWFQHVNLFSAIPDSTGRKVWNNGVSNSFGSISGRENLYGGSGATATNIAFRNDYFYIAARGGVSAFSQAAYSSFKLYGFKTLDSDILQNYNAIKGRYGL
jgi:hypothetical protein